MNKPLNAMEQFEVLGGVRDAPPTLPPWAPLALEFNERMTQLWRELGAGVKWLDEHRRHVAPSEREKWQAALEGVTQRAESFMAAAALAGCAGALTWGHFRWLQCQWWHYGEDRECDGLAAVPWATVEGTGWSVVSEEATQVPTYVAPQGVQIYIVRLDMPHGARPWQMERAFWAALLRDGLVVCAAMEARRP
jgi:hypothetical protein